MSTSPGSAKNNRYFYPCESFRFSIVLVRNQWRIRRGGGMGFNLPSEVFFFACQYENCHGLAFSRTLTPPPPRRIRRSAPGNSAYNYTDHISIRYTAIPGNERNVNHNWRHFDVISFRSNCSY